MIEIGGHRAIGVAGFKNSGKTTLVEKLVRHLTGLGYRVSTIKHAHHSFDIDHEGRDSFRHRKAGATEVAVVSRERAAVIHELRGEEEPSLEKLLVRLSPCDLVIIEGYKRDAHDKIELRNLELDHPRLAGEDQTVVAIAANGTVANAPVPVFDRDDVAALACFIISHCKLGLPGVGASLKLRRAGPSDAEAVRALTREVYAKWIAAIGREPFPMTADYERAVEHHWIDLHEIDGELVALIEMIPMADHLLVENLAVSQDRQGQGLGRALIAHALGLARAAGLAEVRLNTNQAFTANLRFYEGQGFESYKTEAIPTGGLMACFRKRVS